MSVIKSNETVNATGKKSRYHELVNLFVHKIKENTIQYLLVKVLFFGSVFIFLVWWDGEISKLIIYLFE